MLPDMFAAETEVSDKAIRAAVTRAIPLLEAGSAGAAEQRTCFTCHNQALPILALSAAKQQGFTVDETNLETQLDHTFAHLQRGRKNYLKGKGQGGQVITAGYAMWALEAGAHPADETTAAVTSYLLQYQGKSDHWRHPGSRPPSSGSDFTTTYVALRSLATFGTPEQAAKIKDRTDQVRAWLLSAEPQDTEDFAFRLRALNYADASDQQIAQATNELIAAQREDGGWAQTRDMESDAYATATALVALQARGMSTAQEVIQRGLRFLLNDQLEDGSWHVVTRAKPFQTYFESGFPHEKDQFISIAASSWATLALVSALPEQSAASGAAK